MMMFSKSPLALAFLLLASIFAAVQSGSDDELRTGVPYYMVPYIFAIGGGVAPVKIGNDECPLLVRYTREVNRGIPIVFSTSLVGSGESVAIDEETDVYISFNESVCEGLKTWGYRYIYPLPSEVSVELVNLFKLFVQIKFRVKKQGQFFSVYSPQVTDSHGNKTLYYPVPASDSTRRLVLSSKESSILYSFAEATKEYQGMIKSVV